MVAIFSTPVAMEVCMINGMGIKQAWEGGVDPGCHRCVRT